MEKPNIVGRMIEYPNGKREYLCNNGRVSKYSNDLLVKVLSGFRTYKFLTGSVRSWNTETDNMWDYRPEAHTILVITEDNELIIYDPVIFDNFQPEVHFKNYFFVKDAMKKFDLSERQITRYCNDNCFPGAKKVGNTWIIPKNCRDPRIVNEELKI